ncbi:MAG TPA: tetratricopeptide repeat protein [Chthonomonadaceae bacterium]|nr:tetratricopeptide repeat protein [Chthonomonadaceae bacterium]
MVGFKLPPDRISVRRIRVRAAVACAAIAAAAAVSAAVLKSPSHGGFRTPAPAADSAVDLLPPPAPPASPDPALWRNRRDFLLAIPPDVTPQQSIALAGQAREIGDCWSARALLKRQLPRAPASAPLLVALGDTERALLDDAGARTHYLQAVRQDPADVDAYVGLANLAQASGNHAEAWRRLHEALTTAGSSGTAESYRTLARAYQDMNDAHGAEQALRKALDSAPDDSRAELQMAELLVTAGRLPEARPLLDRVLAAHPDSVRACRLFAAWLVHPANPQPDFARARALLEKAVALDPRDVEAHRALALVYRHERLDRLAARTLVAVLNLEPGSADARYQLGQLYTSLGQSDAGRAQLALAESLRRRQRETDALYVAALKRPRDIDARLALGRANEATGQFAEAIWEYQICAELRPVDPRGRHALQHLYARMQWIRRAGT